MKSRRTKLRAARCSPESAIRRIGLMSTKREGVSLGSRRSSLGVTMAPLSQDGERT